MTITRLGRLAAALTAAVLTVTACSSSGTGAGSSGGPTSSPTVSGPMLIPSPNSAQTVDLLHGLRKLHLPHSEDGGKLIGHARNLCQEIKAHEKPKAVVKYARQEFGAAKPLPAKTARKIVKVVKHAFC